MMAAPRVWTVGMKVSATQASSPMASQAEPPFTVACTTSGYCVAEWLPQMVMFLTSATCTPVFWATCVSARLWSRRIIAVKRSFGTSGAECMAMRALVLAGLPTTSTLTSSAARSLMALPCTVKMAPLASSRSPRSMPLVRGRAPTSMQTFAPSKASLGSSVATQPDSSGKAQSSSSMPTPSRAPRACGISSMRSSTGVSGPSSWPLAIRNSSA